MGNTLASVLPESLLWTAAPATGEAGGAEDTAAEPDYGVQRLYSLPAKFGRVTIAAGSVVDFSGEAIVNAANTGCLGGGGVDGAISSRGGHALYQARVDLPVLPNGDRCEVGDAKTTIAGELDASWVIHAVGPSYHNYAHEAEADALLYSAYRSAMREARFKRLPSVGFSLISSGIFRGSRPLDIVLRIGVVAVAANAYPALKEASLVAFTLREQESLLRAARLLCPDPESGALDYAAALEDIDSPALLELHEKSLAEQVEEASKEA